MNKSEKAFKKLVAQLDYLDIIYLIALLSAELEKQSQDWIPFDGDVTDDVVKAKDE